MTCKIYRFLYKIVPIVRWQAFLMDSHLARCPHCKEEYAADDGMDAVGVRRETTDPGIDLWDRVEARLIAIEKEINASEKKRIPRRRSRWAWALTGAAALLLALLIPLKVFRHPGGPGGIDSVSERDEKIIINSITVEKQPAETIYFQPEDKDRLIVWVKRM